MIISLPISYPTITSFPGRADIYAISESNQSIIPWLMENYIQTESLYMEEQMECDIDFYIPPQVLYRGNSALETQYNFNPYLKVMSIKTKMINEEGIIDFMIERIKEGFYVNMDINTKYVSNYDFVDLHTIFIYGFDDEKKIFFAADFFMNGKYSFQTCNFQEIEAAVEKYDKSIMNWGGLFNEESILSLVKIDNDFKYKFDIKRFKNAILEYLNEKHEMEMVFRATNRLREETPYREFGNLHYDNVMKFVRRSFDLKSTIQNVRVFHVLYDHKVALKQRIEYIGKQGYDVKDIYDDMSEIVRDAMVVRNLIIKNRIVERTDNLLRVDDKLKKMKEKEYITLMRLVELCDNSNID